MSELTSKELMKALQAPFEPYSVEWRVQVAGKTSGDRLYAILVPYITNRAIQERLDEVVGIDGWKNEFADTPNSKGTLCGLSIRLNGEWLTKWDGAEDSDMEAVKGGLSGAMKRAAVQWGIGRYLYNLESAIVTPQTDKPQSMDGWVMTQVKIEGRKERIYFKRPTLPAWALPEAK